MELSTTIVHFSDFKLLYGGGPVASGRADEAKDHPHAAITLSSTGLQTCATNRQKLTIQRLH